MLAAMGSGRHSVALLLTALLVKGIVSKVLVEDKNGKLTLKCEKSAEGSWRASGSSEEKKIDDLGPLSGDPRGTYTCKEENKPDSTDVLQVYVRMCVNCIEMDPGSISGIVVADAIFTVLIAVAVYYVSGSERGRSSRASDKQVLIPNDQLYQPLRDREDSAYSHIKANRPRRK